MEFIAEAGGYREPRWWLSLGWAQACLAEGWESPLYWTDRDGGRWHSFTLSGYAAG